MCYCCVHSCYVLSPCQRPISARPWAVCADGRRKTEPSMRFLDATVTSGNRAKGHKPQALNRLDREAVEKAKREADQMDDSLQRLTNEFHKWVNWLLGSSHPLSLPAWLTCLSTKESNHSDFTVYLISWPSSNFSNRQSNYSFHCSQVESRSQGERVDLARFAEITPSSWLWSITWCRRFSRGNNEDGRWSLQERRAISLRVSPMHHLLDILIVARLNSVVQIGNFSEGDSSWRL